MKLNFNDNIKYDDWPKPGDPFSSRFISNYTQMVKQLSVALGGFLTFGDNMNAALFAASCTHATGVKISNPLRNNSAPVQLLVLPVLTPILSYTWNYAPATSTISLTVNYDGTNYGSSNAAVVGAVTGKTDSPFLLVIGG